MKKSMLLLLVFTNTLAFAATVDWDVAVFNPFGGESALGVQSNLLPPYYLANTVIWCNVINVPSSRVTISAHNVLLTPGTMWRQMKYGELVDSSSTHSSFNDFFVRHDANGFACEQDIVLRYGDSVYLGFVIFAADNIYGWVQLGWDEKGITVWDSAMEITGLGIYAGTGIAVPEPSTALLAIIGISSLCLRRRHQDPRKEAK